MLPRVSLRVFPFLVCCFLLSPPHHTYGVEAERCGDWFNAEALRGIRSVCVDTSYLEPAVAADVKTFVDQESQPRHLLTHLSWRIAKNCTAADAIIRVYFTQTEQVSTAEGLKNGFPLQTSPVNTWESGTEVVLLVYDRPSVRLLYRTEAVGLQAHRVTLLRNPFRKLVRDVRTLER